MEVMWTNYANELQSGWSCAWKPRSSRPTHSKHYFVKLHLYSRVGYSSWSLENSLRNQTPVHSRSDNELLTEGWCLRKQKYVYSGLIGESPETRESGLVRSGGKRWSCVLVEGFRGATGLNHRVGEGFNPRQPKSMRNQRVQLPRRVRQV